MKRLEYATTIAAPAATVWQHITSPDSYRHWTSAFCEGSYFEGSWAEGERIRFLSPGGEGMLSEIAEAREAEYLGIRHLAASPTPPRVESTGFELTELGADFALLTYQSVEHAEDTGLIHPAHRASHRASLWARCGDVWQLLYHQGTPRAS